ncbi:hypothetical protein L873DRAFT_1830394 [Choiromyces venosus 120613-1]|uniref:3-phosphoshikimate 1-carboxyvinyltransferase n=1 Tax=Choiromyces venosus 120613-1 TaxID=1336337 RepID=A0A3N4J7L9_9PEZI|nr:hypothetical protein L873DRAFT_1830394 [Choiromyces venosus 120613-1]
MDSIHVTRKSQLTHIFIKTEKKKYLHPTPFTVQDSITADILQHLTSSTYVLITDTNLAPLYLPTFESSFNKNAPKYSPEARLLSYTIPPGEYSKSRTTKAEVEDWMHSEKCTRDTLVIALGVVFIQMPTMLLAIVDSLIGGKNLIGAFWQPERVFIDMKFLETLPEREFINGMAEVVKTAAIWDEAELSRLEQNAELILETVKAKSSDSGQIGNIQNVFKDVILGSLRVKAYVVSTDERKGGLRNLLNFGRSIGHVNEVIILPQMLHGECVAIGVIKEAELARLLGVCKLGAVARLSKCLTSYSLPTSIEDKHVKKLTGGKHCEVERMLVIMGVDKKNDGRKKKVVLLAAISRTHEKKASVVNDDSIRVILSLSLIVHSQRSANLLHSDDTEHMHTALHKLRGIQYSWEEDGDILVLHACGDELYLSNAGMAARFQTSIATLVSPSSEHDSIGPIGSLVDALRSNGSAVQYLESQGSLPVRVPSTSGHTGRRIELEAKVSSQYVSSIPMCSPYAREPVTLSLLYIDMTVAMMTAFGIEVTKSATDEYTYHIAKRSYKNPAEYVVESDAGSATYPLAIVAMTRSTVTVANIGKKSLQGDAHFAEDVLRPMGCTVEQSDYSTTVRGQPRGQLKPLPHVDMEHMTDAFLTASVLAAVANSAERTSVTTIANQRVKECNRIAAIVHKLRKFAVTAGELEDGIWIQGIDYNSLKTPEGGVHCYDDHRVAMSFSVLALIAPNPVILQERKWDEKTWPGWWDVLGIELLDKSQVKEESEKKGSNRTIVIIGMRGTGKTTMGIRAAKILNRPLLDLDTFLAIVTGNSDYHEKLPKKTRSFFEAMDDINAVTIGSDAVEVRIDLLVDTTDSNGVATVPFVSEQLAGLKGKIQLPIVFTIRTKSQGGKFPDGNQERALELDIAALRMGLESIDLEITWPVALLETVTSSKGYSKIIASHNDVGGDLPWSNASLISKFNSTLKYWQAKSIQDNYDLENFRKCAATYETRMALSRILNSFLTPVTHPVLPFKAAQGQLSIAEILQALSLIGMLEAKMFYMFRTPIPHSRSPALHNTLFQSLGLPYTYHLLNPPIDDFGGASVTIPHKVSIIPLLSSISAQAQVIGAVNTVIPVIAEDGTRKLVGDNFDWCGIQNSPRIGGVTEQENPSAATALIISAGGTSLAVVYALHKIGCGKIDVINSTPANLKSLVEAFPKEYNLVTINSLAEAKSVDVKPITVVSTVPVDKPVDDLLKAILQKLLTRGASAKVLAEMAYKPRVTEVMNLVDRGGWKVVPGLEALAGQGVGQFEFWAGAVANDLFCKFSRAELSRIMALPEQLCLGSKLNFDFLKNCCAGITMLGIMG